MSINPATDIVLDVARAVDPTRYKQAVAKLDKAAGVGFSDSLAAEETAPVRAPVLPATTVAVPKASAAATDKSAATYRQFEAMALANMLEAAMPKDESFFGKGVAGDTWKSMLIDQIAAQMARHGGIGIANELAHSIKEADARRSGANPAAAAPSAAAKSNG